LVGKQFIIDANKFNRRKRTTIQHKLRVVMNCYTLSDFTMNEENNSFSFRKNYKIHGKRIEDPKVLTGHFNVEYMSENQCKITIIVNT